MGLTFSPEDENICSPEMFVSTYVTTRNTTNIIIAVIASSPML